MLEHEKETAEGLMVDAKKRKKKIKMQLDEKIK